MKSNGANEQRQLASAGPANIGMRLPRAHARTLVAGAGQFLDDISPAGTLHAAFARSPFAHARITRIDTNRAKLRDGIAAILTGKDFEGLVKPWQSVMSHIPALRSAVQTVMPIDHVCWTGEPVAMVIAETRALAEDAVGEIEIEWDPLSPVTNVETALNSAVAVIHPELGSNLAFERKFETGDVHSAMREADFVVEREFLFDRCTGVTPEPRGIIADYSAADGRLSVYHSGQTPHVMQALLSKHLGIEEDRIRVISRDVGGGYGIKIHIYGDELATAAAAKLLRRPIKFVADRLESFLTDVHARGHRVRAKIWIGSRWTHCRVRS